MPIPPYLHAPQCPESLIVDADFTWTATRRFVRCSSLWQTEPLLIAATRSHLVLRTNLASASDIGARDAEPSHHGVQGRPVQPETSGGRGDHAVALPEHPDDVIPLHLLKRSSAG